MRAKTIKQILKTHFLKILKIIKLMVEIKLKKPNALIQNQSVKSNQAIKPKHPFKSVLACFYQDG